MAFPSTENCGHEFNSSSLPTLTDPLLRLFTLQFVARLPRVTCVAASVSAPLSLITTVATVAQDFVPRLAFNVGPVNAERCYWVLRLGAGESSGLNDEWMNG